MKTALVLVCMLSTLSSVQLPNQVNQVEPVNAINVVQVQQGNELITPRADVIKRIYRISHGVLQYRRWNQTRGYWVDPEWING